MTSVTFITISTLIGFSGEIVGNVLLIALGCYLSIVVLAGVDMKNMLKMPALPDGS